MSSRCGWPCCHCSFPPFFCLLLGRIY